jgi:hypothetical protein
LCCIKIGISPSTLKSSIFVENGHVATSVDFSRLLTQDEQIHDPMVLPCIMSHSPDVLWWVDPREKDPNDGTFPHGHLSRSHFSRAQFLDRATMG